MLGWGVRGEESSLRKTNIVHFVAQVRIAVLK